MYSIPPALLPMFPRQFGGLAFASALTALAVVGHASPTVAAALPDLAALDGEAAQVALSYASLRDCGAPSHGDAVMCCAASWLAGVDTDRLERAVALLDAVHGLSEVPDGALPFLGDLAPVTFPTALDLGGGLRWVDLDDVPRAVLAGDLARTAVGVLAMGDLRFGRLGTHRTHHALVHGEDEIPVILAVASVARPSASDGLATVVTGPLGADPYRSHAGAIQALALRLGVPLPASCHPGHLASA